MTAGRVLASLTAAAAVGGCVVAVLAMSSAGDSTPAAAGSTPNYVITQRTLPVSVSPAVSFAASNESAPHAALLSAAPRTTTAGAVTTAPAGTTHAQPPATFTPPPPSSPGPPSTRAATSAAAHTEASSTPAASTLASLQGVALPVKYRTYNATRVLTVTATSRGRTTARLQAWHKAPGGGWLKSGTAMTAHIGSQGMTRTPSEGASATPMGSFTLTRAFGRNADPGTSLPYFRTRPSDWWISQPGPLYNTHQRCSSGCKFTQSMPPNEHLYYETPYYNYAVVIDYNTRNAPGGVTQGAGSAFFLHVTDGYPTAGCVAVPQRRLVTLMRWLRPSTHPRILIGLHR